MAINRALMNRQMYNMGGPSLQTGAPDITLTGDMRPTYSAMRKQRMAYGGIAGADGRKNYGIGSFFQEKIMDPIKENPYISAAVGAGLLNQFGLPDFVTDNIDFLSDDAGKNFLGDLIGKDLVIGPGGEQLSDIANIDDINKYLTTGGYFGESGGSIVDEFGEAGRTGMESSPTISITDVLKNVGLPSGGVTGAISNALGIPDVISQLPESVQQAILQQTTGGSGGTAQRDAAGNVTYEQKRRDLNADLAKALAAGTAAGAYVESQPKDELPTDTTGLDIPAIAQAARGTDAEAAAAGLRFLPPQVTRAANGGRIGFANGGDGIIGSQEDFNKFLEDMKQRDMSNMQNEILRNYKEYMKRKKMIEQMPEAKDGGRIGAQEGGLMDLGGMEKDYREEGGFVPIGGKERADDVPARLSKNEFVFTADAVRNAGGGDIDEGAQVMENVMRHLEAGGTVSPDSQGLEGAREMFETSQRLEKRII